MQRGSFFRSAKNCRKMLAILLAIILVSSLIACLISSNMGQIKISHIMLDGSRGAVLEADLFIPAGTSDSDKLPAIVVTHGRGANVGQVKGIAEELARRGYVVMNVASYGTGLSEMAISDDGQQGEEVYFIDDSPQGVLDAVNYLRTMGYVDTENIGIVGHSSGSRKAGYTAILDCGYTSMNDRMLNVLSEQFGLDISERDLNRDADEIAQERLPADKLDYYEYLKQEQQAEYDTRVKAICLVGSDANRVGPSAQITVAGHEVTRSCKVNIGIINGEWDYSYRDYYKNDVAKQAWYTGGADIAQKTWYALDDVAQTSQQVGQFNGENGEELSQAIADRSARVYMISPNESHAKNMMSAQTTTSIIQFFGATLNHTSDVADGSIVFPVRAFFNGIAMTAMLLLALPLTGLFMSGRSGAAVLGREGERTAPAFRLGKGATAAIALVSVAAGYLAIYRGNGANFAPFTKSPFPNIFRLVIIYRNTTIYVAITGIVALVMLLVLALWRKKKTGKTGLEVLGLRVGFKQFGRYLGMALAILAVCYLSLMVIQYLFNQDYRFWLGIFTSMKVENWAVAAAYAILLLPFYLCTAAVVNYTARTDIPAWKDTLFAIVVNSAGVWLCCLTNLLVLLIADQPFSLFTTAYQLVFLVPMVIYLLKKLYQLTGSIWPGSLTAAMLIAWSLVSTIGNNDSYYAIGIFSRIFNI